MKQLEFWKENEYVRMNSKIDEVKQACQRDMDSMHQKNRNLENVSSDIYVQTFIYFCLTGELLPTFWKKNENELGFCVKCK